MKEHIIKNITDKADVLAVEYNKTKDPLIREEWFQLVRSLDYLSSHNANFGYNSKASTTGSAKSSPSYKIE